MSWMSEAVGGPPPVYTGGDGYPTVPDPDDPDRMVSAKPANKPFLAHKEYRKKQEGLHNAWLERKKERDAKVARGEAVGPEEQDPTAEEEVGVLGLLKFLLYVAIIFLLIGKFVTGSYFWNYEVGWTQLRAFWPTNDRLLSERVLAEYDGSDPTKPLYLAIDHDVYDVSSNRETYGPGGAYHMMAGVDAARSFATGCFREHRTHDLRGLTESELEAVQHWKKFFAEHKRYFKVGRVLHHPIDPASPTPEHCDANRREPDEIKSGSESRGGPRKGDGAHEEL